MGTNNNYTNIKRYSEGFDSLQLKVESFLQFDLKKEFNQVGGIKHDLNLYKHSQSTHIFAIPTKYERFNVVDESWIPMNELATKVFQWLICQQYRLW